MHTVGFLERVTFNLLASWVPETFETSLPRSIAAREEKTASIHGNLQGGGESGSRKKLIGQL